MKEVKVTWGRKTAFAESAQSSHQLNLTIGETVVTVSSKVLDGSAKNRPRNPPQRADTPKPKIERPRPKANPGVMAIVSIDRNGVLHTFNPKMHLSRGKASRSIQGVRLNRQIAKPVIVDVKIEGEQGEFVMKSEFANKVRIRLA